MLIRPYDDSDQESVAAINVDTVVTSVAVMQFGDGRFTWQESPLEVARNKCHDLAGYLDEHPRPWTEGFVAVLDGMVLGFAASSLSGWNRRLILHHMYVDGAARGSGVGRALLRSVLAGDSAKNAQHVWLETQEDNVPAIRAYERMGFRVVGLDQTLYGDREETDTAVFMSRSLLPRNRPGMPQ